MAAALHVSARRAVLSSPTTLNSFNFMNKANPQDKAREVVEQFIKGVNERSAEAVRAVASEQIEMTFPGGLVMRSVEEFFDWLAGRSPRSTYTYDVIDIVTQEDRVVAYAGGRAEGITATGVAFSGVRVMDKFVIREGRVIAKEAYSDMSDFIRQAAQSRTSA